MKDGRCNFDSDTSVDMHFKGRTMNAADNFQYYQDTKHKFVKTTDSAVIRESVKSSYVEDVSFFLMELLKRKTVRE